MITIALDSSQITTFLKCSEKWNLAGREHLVLSDMNMEAMNKGSVFHKLLELYYVARFEKGIFDAAQDAKIQFAASEEINLISHEIRDFLLSRFTDYVMYYQQSDFQPLRVEGIPSIELGFSSVFYEDPFRKFVIEGKIDLLTSYRGNLSFVDHKTQSRANKIYPYTPQFLTYAMVTKAKTAVANMIRWHKEVEKNTFERIPMTFMPHQIEQWKRQVMLIFLEIYAELATAELENRSPKFEKNYGECGGAFNSYPCQFTHLCELNPESKELYENIRKFKYHERIWSPWEVKEIV